MHYQADSELIEKIWQALNSPKVSKKPSTIAQLTNRFIDQGWTDIEDVSDLLWATDGRLHVQVSNLASALSIPTKYVYQRPLNPPCYGRLILDVADATNLLIQLERLGFENEPSILVDPLMERLKKSDQLTDSELSVVWYQKQRHKCVPMILVATAGNIGQKIAEIKTKDKYKTEIWRDESGKATMLQAFAPKHRRENASWLTAAE